MRKGWKIVLRVLIVLAAVVIVGRLLTPEDTWLCVNGEWVKHGVPYAPKPDEPCR